MKSKNRKKIKERLKNIYNYKLIKEIIKEKYF
jgi:hypothetical protein